MKKIISLLLMAALFSTSVVLSFAASPYDSQESQVMDIYALANMALAQEEASQIESEIAILNDNRVDTSIIKRINVTENGNEYILGYKGIDEKVTIKNSDNESTTIIASDGEKSNVICFMKDGSLIIDGYKIQISEVDPTYGSPKGVIYKSEKSLSPYGSLKASDYNKYLSSGKQNIALGQALDKLTVTALANAMSYCHPYLGITVSIASVASSVKDVLAALNPKTENLGCEYTTYTTVGGTDYKYRNRFYANRQCTGKYSEQLSYEHFIVM